MERDHWTFIGQIDCFGIASQLRDRLLAHAQRVAYREGGELQLAKAPDQYYTDRYDLHCDLPGHPEPFHRFLAALAQNLPPDHEPITIQAYDRANMQREDLIIRRNRMLRRPYVWQPAEEQPIYDDGDEIAA